MRTSTRKFNLRGKNYYEILGVGAWADANEIRLAWREAALVFHPDHGGTDEGFRLIQEAYETLGSDATRAVYDKKHGLGPTPHDVESFKAEEGRRQGGGYAEPKTAGAGAKRAVDLDDDDQETRATPEMQREARSSKLFEAIVNNLPVAAAIVGIVWGSVALRSLVGHGLWGVLNPTGTPSWPGVPITTLLMGTLWACLLAAGLRWWAKPYGRVGIVLGLLFVGVVSLLIEAAASVPGIVVFSVVLVFALVVRERRLFVRKPRNID